MILVRLLGSWVCSDTEEEIPSCPRVEETVLLEVVEVVEEVEVVEVVYPMINVCGAAN